jgi:hypothetical protein
MRGRYDLKIKEPGAGKWVHVDLGDTDIAMNFEVNDIAEVKSATNNWSQEIRLPVTSTNNRLLEMAQHPQAATDLPYRTLPCRLYCDGIQIAGKGSYIIIRGIQGRYYKCQIAGGNKDFFNELKSKPVSDLNLGVFRLLMPSLNSDNWTDDKSLYPDRNACFMSLVTFIAQNTIPAGSQSVFNPVYVTGINFPFVRITAILDMIMDGSGYTLDDRSARHLYGNDALSLADLTDAETDTSAKAEIVSSSMYWVYYGYDPNLDREDKKGMAEFEIYSNEIHPQIGSFIINNRGDEQGITYESLVEQDVDVIVRQNPQYARVGWDFKLSVYSGDILVWSDERSPNQFVENDADFLNVHLPQNSKMRLGFTSEEAEAHDDQFIIEITNVRPQNECVWGAKFTISERLGFATQFDFLSFLMKTYGLTVNVDETTNRVCMFNYQLLYDNRRAAFTQKSDKVRYWTDKLNNDGNAALSFRLSEYARNNYIRFEDNETDGVSDSASITINDSVLNNEKDMFILPVQAGKDVPVRVSNNMIVPMPNIPLFELPAFDADKIPPIINMDVISNAKPVKIKPHIVSLAGSNQFYLITNHRPLQNIVSTCYSSLQKMLKKIRIIEAQFNLTPFDVKNFDFTKPVYLHQYGAFFYVLKISNYRVGYLTKVTLIKL